MNNVMLDPLPQSWNGYSLDSSFRIGIQLSQCLADKDLSMREKMYQAVELLFPADKPPINEAAEAIQWFLNGYSHDKHKGNASDVKLMDFDVDQWRIYAAFIQQYRIDLSNAQLHWWTFMGLLTNLDECSFTRVMDIRCKKITTKMSADEKKAIKEAKKVYTLTIEEDISSEERLREEEAVAHFRKLIGR